MSGTFDGDPGSFGFGRDSDVARRSSGLLAAQEHERRRLASELHDGLGQQLCALKIALDGIRKDLDARLDLGERESMTALAQRITAMIDETRRMAKGLRPPLLETFGALAAVEWLCRDFAQIYAGVSFELDVRAEEQAVVDEAKLALFRIVQEACNNACKHAGAKRVRVAVSSDAEAVRLCVEDNGRGFDLQASSQCSSCLGLHSMRERAEQSGGDFAIASAPGEGTRITVTWPPAGAD